MICIINFLFKQKIMTNSNTNESTQGFFTADLEKQARKLNARNALRTLVEKSRLSKLVEEDIIDKYNWDSEFFTDGQNITKNKMTFYEAYECKSLSLMGYHKLCKYIKEIMKTRLYLDVDVTYEWYDHVSYIVVNSTINI